MIYLFIPGHSGFGNQLFMYAKAYAVASEKKDKMTIINLTTNNDDHPFMLDKLKLDETVCSLHRVDHVKNKYLRSLTYRFWDHYRQHIRNCDKIVETEWSRKYREYVYDRLSPNIYVEGYFESYRYFENCSEKIKEQFVPVVPVSSPYLKMAQESNSVALHIRGGDFVTLNRAIDSKYYFEAIDKMRELVEHPRFFLVTLEPEVRKMVKEYIGDKEELVIVDVDGEDKDFVEWNILCNCKNHIISNSTYSWWGAYLNGDSGVVLIPDMDRYKKAESIDDDCIFWDFYKEDWMIV